METVLMLALKSILMVVILLTIFAHFMLIERKILGYFQLGGTQPHGPLGTGSAHRRRGEGYHQRGHHSA